MSSRAASAFVPSSRTVVPFTVTRPSSISFSEARREAIPACDRIFWIRSMAISNPCLARRHEAHEDNYRLALRVLRDFVVYGGDSARDKLRSDAAARHRDRRPVRGRQG